MSAGPVYAWRDRRDHVNLGNFAVTEFEVGVLGVTREIMQEAPAYILTQWTRFVRGKPLKIGAYNRSVYDE